MPADHGRSVGQSKLAPYYAGGLLDFHPGLGRLRRPPRRFHLSDVDRALVVAPGIRIAGQYGDIWVDFLDDESALAGAGLDQASGDEPLHRIPDGVPGRVVLLPELKLGGQLAASLQAARLDLL